MNFPPPTPKQAHVIWFATTTFAVAICLALLAGLLWGLSKALDLLGPVLWPLAVAAVIACVLDPIVDWLEHRKVRRTAGIIIVFGVALILLATIFAMIVPRLVDEAGELADRIPTYAKRLQASVVHWMAEPPQPLHRFFWRPEETTRTTNVLTAPAASTETTNVIGPLGPRKPASEEPSLEKRMLTSLTDWATNFLPKVGQWLLERLSQLAGLLGIFVGLGLIPVYTFYFLQEKRGIESKWTDYLPVQDSHFKDELVFVLNAITEYLVSFFRGQVLVAACDAVLYTIGFLSIGLHYAFLLGVMALFLTLVPFLGALVISVTALILAAVQFQDLLHPLLVLGVFGLVQAVEGFVIQPKIMGDRVGLHPLTILIALMVGTTVLGGVLGGILAIPLTAVLRVVMFRYIWKRRSGKQMMA